MTMARVRNWQRFQHYKDRSPPWIKLHRELLDDFEFSRLPIASKALAPMIWMLAAESNDGTVRVDPDWLAFRLRWDLDDVVAGLSPLIERGFLECDSSALADCLQVATPEREGETERETASSSAAPSDAPADLTAKRQERAQRLAQATDDAIAAFNASRLVKPNAGRLATVSPKVGREKRQQQVAKALRVASSICAESYGGPIVVRAFWDDYFAHCHADDFLSGRQGGGRDHANWLPDFEFLTRETTVLKVYDRVAGAA